VLTDRRRPASLLLGALLVVSLAVPAGVAAGDPPAPPLTPAASATPEFLAQAELDLVALTNRVREGLGLIDLRRDPDLQALAHDRAVLMAETDILSHTEPDGRKVFDHLDATGMPYYSAGEIIAWNTYPLEYTTGQVIEAWMASPGHHDVMVSTGYNYVGFGAALSATGKIYYAGLFVREPDETGAWASFGRITKRSISHGRARVTLRWSGGDSRLQVLTAGLRYYQVQRRRVGGAWHTWNVTTSTHRTVVWSKRWDREVRVRARDRAGNWGPWQVVRINL
jgi:uncharacterized protein YkwD